MHDTRVSIGDSLCAKRVEGVVERTHRVTGGRISECQLVRIKASSFKTS